VIVLVLCGSLLFAGTKTSQLDQYISNIRATSNVYEDEYRDPKTTKITFPEKKRNLIYIYLESMETSYLSALQGGMLDTNVIPELYTLAQENTNFSHNGDVGGFFVAPGASKTVTVKAENAGVVSIVRTEGKCELTLTPDDETFAPRPSTARSAPCACPTALLWARAMCW
jgi:phosphoglycerol transferase